MNTLSHELALDTDIGTDVDDLIALATLLGSEEAISAVTTVYGDTTLRARIVAHIAELAGADVGPIVPGARTPMSGRSIFWAGHEGKNTPSEVQGVREDLDATDLLTQADLVLAIGPLTNAALAADRGVRAGSQLFVMGGDFSGQPEHNIMSDITAADRVFSSGWAATVVGTDQTRSVRLGADFLAEIEPLGELGRVLAAEIRTFWSFSDEDSNVPHDPLAVLMITDPELFTFATGTIHVDLDPAAEGKVHFTPSPDGPHRIVADLDPVQVALRIRQRVVAALTKATH